MSNKTVLATKSSQVGFLPDFLSVQLTENGTALETQLTIYKDGLSFEAFKFELEAEGDSIEQLAKSLLYALNNRLQKIQHDSEEIGAMGFPVKLETPEIDELTALRNMNAELRKKNDRYAEMLTEAATRNENLGIMLADANSENDRISAEFSTQALQLIEAQDEAKEALAAFNQATEDGDDLQSGIIDLNDELESWKTKHRNLQKLYNALVRGAMDMSTAYAKLALKETDGDPMKALAMMLGQAEEPALAYAG